MKKIILILLSVCIVASAETEFAKPIPSIDNPRQIVFAIKSGDEKEIKHVLKSANNVLNFYGPEKVQMEIVAYYQGIKSLLKTNKEIASKVKDLMLLDVEFVACANAMRANNIKKDELIENATIVSAGVVELIERTKDGWVNILP